MSANVNHGSGNERWISMIHRIRFTYDCCQKGSFPFPHNWVITEATV